MPETSLIKKLHIKPGYRIGLWNVPEGYYARLADLPANVEVSEQANGTFDLVHLFVSSKAQLDVWAARILAAVKPGGVLCVAYHKKSSKIKTDITRDIGWESMAAAGWEGVAIISIDETWSSLRLQPSDQIPARNRKKKA